jgi:PKD-like domain
MQLNMHKNTSCRLRWSSLTALFFALNLCAVFAQLPLCSTTTTSVADCEEVNCVNCNLHGFTGSTNGFGQDPDNDLLLSGWCGINQSVQYIPFSAASSSMLISITSSGCAFGPGGVAMGIMHICDQGILSCSPGNGTGSNSLVINNLIVGETYILILDFHALGTCSFTIQTNPINGTILPSTLIPANLTLSGPTNVCPGASTVYEIAPVTFNADFFWTGPPGSTINGVPYPAELQTASPTVTVIWGNTGGEICVYPKNACVQGNTFCLPVTVTPIPTTVLPDPPKICAEDVPYILPWGEEAYTSGTYFNTLPNFLGCDSMIQQTIAFLPPKTKDLPAVTLCEGGCVTVCGQEYCGYGGYAIVCQTASGCDSTINFSIVPPNLVASIQGGGTITCAVPSITLTAAPSSGVKTWYKAGQQVGMGGLLTVTSPGTYVLVATLMLNGEECVKTDSIKILKNTTPPPVTTTDAVVECDTLPVRINASTPVNPALYLWTGPNGFSSNLPNPIVTDVGTYILTVFDIVNGCFSIDSAHVTRCCHTYAGTLDSQSLFVCGSNSLAANFLGNENLETGDSLVFILYTDPANPLGSILMVSDTTVFPFIPGVTQPDSTYYVAAAAGPVSPNDSINVLSPCFSLSPGQPVIWAAKPSIQVSSAPNMVCVGQCIDVTFQFTGVPPFQFHYEIAQNGQLLYAQDDSSAGFQKTITVCPSAFSVTPGTQDFNFSVNFLSDGRCTCEN